MDPPLLVSERTAGRPEFANNRDDHCRGTAALAIAPLAEYRGQSTWAICLTRTPTSELAGAA